MNYEDIIGLPHPTSKRHLRMSMWDRAAQFAPFAALTGHSDAMEETARQTQQQYQLEEDDKKVLDRKLMFLRSKIAERHEVTFTYFMPDARKEGGSYQIAKGVIRKMDDETITLEDQQIIIIQSILDMQCSLFDTLMD